MRLNVELRQDIYEELAAHAQAQGRSLSDVIRVLINEWCEGRRRVEERPAWARPSQAPGDPVEARASR
jgi:predicted CopG family antitoxin